MCMIRVTVLVLGVCSKLASTPRLCLRGDFNNQVLQLIDNVRMSEERIQSIPEVLRSLKRTLDAVWPGSQLEVYGSVASNLALSTSDLDIAVTIPDSTYTDILYKAKEAVQNEPNLYQNVEIFKPYDKVSVLGLYFVPNKIHCDLVFKTTIRTYSSELVKHLILSDDRANKLAFILKLWGNIDNNSKELTHYNMVWLAIFFLQQKHILPTVYELQENVTPNLVESLHFSNVAFNKKPFISKNNESLYELIGGFFNYYDKFDFGKYIVCPFTGQPVEKNLFKNVNHVPNVFSLYKFNVASNKIKPLDLSGAMSIQEPLMHGNISSLKVDFEALERLKSRFKMAASLHRELKEDEFLPSLLMRDCD